MYVCIYVYIIYETKSFHMKAPGTGVYRGCSTETILSRLYEGSS